MSSVPKPSTPAPAPAPRKRVRSPAVKRDPVIAALIANIPGQGQHGFNYSQRVNWLRMMAMAFDGAFGVVSAISIDTASTVVITGREGPMDIPGIPASKPAPLIAPAEDDEIRYFVDADGFARKSPGDVRIRPVDIPPGAELEDERADDDSLDTIKWADGQWPPAAYPNPITIVKA